MIHKTKPPMASAGISRRAETLWLSKNAALSGVFSFGIIHR
jgi:hypothetical protein